MPGTGPKGYGDSLEGTVNLQKGWFRIYLIVALY